MRKCVSIRATEDQHNQMHILWYLTFCQFQLQFRVPDEDMMEFCEFRFKGNHTSVQNDKCHSTCQEQKTMNMNEVQGRI